MTNAIFDLWNGNIAPCEHCGSHDPELNHLSVLMERHRETLGKELSEAQNEVLQKYMDCAEEYHMRMLELAFCDGFCIASKLLTESLT